MTRDSAATRYWQGRRVFVTGHTGFKGGWLSLWLRLLGAEVHGYALQPPTQPSLFEVARVEDALASSVIADVRDHDALMRAISRARPEIVFHLAAQSLVRESYRHPVETFQTNVMGVIHVLEAVRATESVKVVVNVTTDKCYENKEKATPYREDEPLGGYDPYSASKACSEIVTAAYRRSFLAEAGIAVATARAGNVIGGGDWAADRLLPDVFRALDSNAQLTIRFPGAVRPWQHVLEPVSGYVRLAERLDADPAAFGDAWNFGPSDMDVRTVGSIVEYVAAREPALSWTKNAVPQPHEANILMLDSSKAHARLGWAPQWGLETALDRTIEWHRAWRRGEDMRAATESQIENYRSGCVEAGIGAI